MAALTAAMLGMGGSVQAEPVASADAFVDQFGASAVEVLASTANDPEARHQQFEELLRSGLDMPKIAALVLGRAWRTADDQQRVQFTEVFEDHLIQTYTRRLDTYAGERLQVIGSSEAGDDVLVESRIVSHQGSTLDVTWRVRQKDAQWRIIDASVEGVSMVVTWRNEFAAVIDRQGLDGLIARLRNSGEQLATRDE